MNKVLLLLIFSCLISATQAQSFAINTDGSAAHNSALLDVKSTGKGMLVPRMSKAQRDAIAAPANGLMVYVNAPDTTGFSFYDGTAWKWMEEKGSGWGLSGNAGINPSVHFIGSTNPADLAFRIWNIERMRLTNEAELGISEPDPKYTLDIKTGFAAINNCVNNGLRIRSSLTANDCENGLLLGFPVNAQNWNNALIWNYGQNGSNPKNILFGLGQYEVMRITDNRELGIDEPAPKYNLDLYAGGTASFQCTDRLGMRINTPYTGSRDCNRGFFLGFNRDGSAVSEKISLWNFTSNATTNGQYFRFGFGQDF
ncbi:MAG: hypothetical protein JNM68_08135, partial [Dinghuibacter sp.]|nr:hypothetical protein [Dinghuibacter sp.]